MERAAVRSMKFISSASYYILFVLFFFFFKQKTAYEIGVRLVGSEMCIRDRTTGVSLCSPGCPGTHFVDQAGLEL